MKKLLMGLIILGAAAGLVRIWSSTPDGIYEMRDCFKYPVGSSGGGFVSNGSGSFSSNTTYEVSCGSLEETRKLAGQAPIFPSKILKRVGESPHLITSFERIAGLYFIIGE